jgi:hypothetical protein
VVGDGVVAAHVLQDVGAGHQLHREEPVVAEAHQLSQPHQVGVVDARGDAELALEAQEPLRADQREHLERYLGAVVAIERLVHDAHASVAQHAEQVKAVGTAEGKRQSVHAGTVRGSVLARSPHGKPPARREAARAAPPELPEFKSVLGGRCACALRAWAAARRGDRDGECLCR